VGFGGYGRDSIVEHGFHYDVNYQYPNAMLKRMPTGDPIFSTNNNLDNYFGFISAKIIPPSVMKLKNLFIQNREESGKVSCPRNTLYRWIFSEEFVLK
jgi:hypothetical protein